MVIDLDRLKRYFRTLRGRNLLIAIPIAVSVNVLVLILFLGTGGKETSALEGVGDGASPRPVSPSRGKRGLGGRLVPVRPPGGPSRHGPASPAAEGSETIAGRVVAEDGRAPLPGALVRVTQDLSREDDERVEWTGPFQADGGGRFRIEGLRFAPYRLRASAPGRLDAELPGVLPGKDVEIALARDGGIPCRVEARNGPSSDPLPGQKVVLELPDIGFSLEAETDRQGRFTITGIARAELERANERGQLEIVVAGFCEPVLVSSPQGLAIAVRRGITVSGVVLEKATGRPIPGVAVRSGSGHSVETDGAGAYRITGVSGSLVALAPGFAPDGQDLMDLDLEGKENHRLDFSLDRGMSLHGRVNDRQGNGLAGVKVAVLVDVLTFALNDRQLENSMKDLLSSTTGPAGDYRITGLPGTALNLPGSLSLEVCPPGLEGGMIQEVEVESEGGDVERNIVLDLAASLTGTVSGADGAPVSAARVSVKSLEEGISLVAATDANGGFEFRSLPAGSYHLEVEALERPALSREITVPSPPLKLRMAR